MNRSERLHYTASDICDQWIEWFRKQSEPEREALPYILHRLQQSWAEDGDLFMRDTKMAMLTYPGFWHPDDIVTGSADDIVWDIAYGMICNYLHEND